MKYIVYYSAFLNLKIIEYGVYYTENFELGKNMEYRVYYAEYYYFRKKSWNIE